ncbi:hypothetical protein GCM10010145_55920 [Streptomyces ruber]|uniref:Solute-binding protein family 5 domain-containing protein n=2 Tax=Streptomyces TaxID=1883 RepID=A0A918BM22_9ACTN|nr:ABC transporter substrate-binding protein [Streptomyces ruber]GGQ79009.1 hypothetical protein GCM10010145_55920 [Streptomyces ruber]
MSAQRTARGAVRGPWPPRRPPSLAVGGCSGGGGTAGRDDDTFVHLIGTGLVTECDPARSYSDEMVALANTYETLTRYDAGTGRAEGVLATRWTSSKDRRTWTFTLRDHVRFRSGHPLTLVVERLCRHVAVLRHGRVVVEGLLADVLRHPAHPATRALRDAVPRLPPAPRPSSDPPR